MKRLFHNITTYLGGLLGGIIGLITTKAVGFLIIQLIAIFIASMFDVKLGVTFLLQFPFSMWVFMGAKR